MIKLMITATTAVLLATGAFAKGHDQGKAGGDVPTLLPGELAGSVDDTVKGGVRGDAASSAGAGNGKAIGRGE